MCDHESKVCKDTKWGTSTGSIQNNKTKENVLSYDAHVSLWHCNSCSTYLMYDWHTQKYLELKGWGEKRGK